MNDKPIQEYTGQPVGDTYQTGSTQPPKSRKGLLAGLLITVIFLCGLVSALSLMNIKLSRQLESLQEPELCTVAFAQAEGLLSCSQDAPLGINGHAVSQFWQDYDRLPQGIYITQVEATCEAAAKGILPGDILVAIDGCPVTDPEQLPQFLHARSIGEQLQLTLYRNGQSWTCLLTLGK